MSHANVERHTLTETHIQEQTQQVRYQNAAASTPSTSAMRPAASTIEVEIFTWCLSPTHLWQICRAHWLAKWRPRGVSGGILLVQLLRRSLYLLHFPPVPPLPPVAPNACSGRFPTFSSVSTCEQPVSTFRQPSQVA